MKTAGRIFILMLACCLMACAGPALSVHPLSSPEKAGHDKRLFGSWYFVEEEGYLFIGRGKDSRERIALISFEDGILEVDELKMFVSELQSGNYMNISNLNILGRRKEEIGGLDKEDQLEMKDCYLFLKYDFMKPDILVTYMLDGDLIEKAVKDKRLKGDVSDKILITDTSENIANFIESDRSGELFTPYLVFKRIAPNIDESLKDEINDVLRKQEKETVNKVIDKEGQQDN